MVREMLAYAKKTVKKSYAPYSKYNVSAVIRCSDGEMFAGVNVENGSYSVTMCAERVALFNAVSCGKRKFAEILVYSNSGSMPYPCGSCLQALSEFADDSFVIYVSNGKKTEKYLFLELFPRRFKL